MAYQSGSNYTVHYKAQSGLGSAASGSGGLGLRHRSGSAGLAMSKAMIRSGEIRADGQSTRGRHGSRTVSGSYQTELSVGSLDTLIAAALRASWTGSIAITQAAMTSITTTTSTIVAAGGSWITQGVRVGDMVSLTGFATSANNGKWFRVTGVTASTISVAGTPLTEDASPDSSFTLTVAKSVVQATTAPTETYFTFEQYYADLDKSLLFIDCKPNKLTIACQPDAPVVVTLGLLGLDASTVSGGSAPSLTSPTYTTTLPLVLADGSIRHLGADVVDFTAFTVDVDLGGSAPPVLAPNPPDVFLNNAKVTGSVSGLFTDFDQFDAFDNETQIDFFAHFKEPESDPSDFVSLFIGNAVYSSHEPGAAGDGPMVSAFNFEAGSDNTGSSHAATMIKFSTSAA